MYETFCKISVCHSILKYVLDEKQASYKRVQQGNLHEQDNLGWADANTAQPILITPILALSTVGPLGRCGCCRFGHVLERVPCLSPPYESMPCFRIAQILQSPVLIYFVPDTDLS
jgi:hypothetical protein